MYVFDEIIRGAGDEQLNYNTTTNLKKKRTVKYCNKCLL